MHKRFLRDEDETSVMRRTPRGGTLMVYQVKKDVCELYVPSGPDDFIKSMNVAGTDWAKRYRYPLSAMIACACVESGFGTSGIYKQTCCPFNLQKPSSWLYPQCTVRLIKTVNKPGEEARFTTFRVADDLYDSARLWCEWISHWPSGSARSTLESYRNDARRFAASLYIVGFANNSKAATQKFADLIDTKGLTRFD